MGPLLLLRILAMGSHRRGYNMDAIGVVFCIEGGGGRGRDTTDKKLQHPNPPSTITQQRT